MAQIYALSLLVCVLHCRYMRVKSNAVCLEWLSRLESYSPTGVRTLSGESGELVCIKPFPCMPLGFWPLPGFGSEQEVEAAKQRFIQAYFQEFEGVWCRCREL